MLKMLPVSSIVFLVVIAAIALAPLQSPLVAQLDGVGRALIDIGTNLGVLVEIPVTVPLYLVTHGQPLAAIQHDAMHDRVLWIAALMIWAALILLSTTKSGTNVRK